MKGFSCCAAVVLSLVVALCGCNSQTSPVAASVGVDEVARPRVPIEIDTRQTLAFLASDELEGRGVGGAGLDRAAEFIADQYRQLGLEPLADDYFQSFEMKTATEIGPDTFLTVADRAFTPKDDFAPAQFSADGRFSGPVVFAGYGIKSERHEYNDYADIDVKGKVALALRFEPHNEKGESRFSKDGWSEAAALTAKAAAAKEAGAVAVLFVTPAEFHNGDDSLITAGGRREKADDIPALRVRQTLAEELLRRGGAGDLKSVQQKIDSIGKPASFELADVEVEGEVDLEHKMVAVKNVVGLLPGEIRDEYVVVGAHYDHLGRGRVSSLARNRDEIHNGADDNASGTTAMLAIASKLAREGTPRRSIIFAAFTAEEEGLIGSKHFVDHSPVPLAQVTAMINLDMIGRIKNTVPVLHPGAGRATTAATTTSATSTAPATTQATADASTRAPAGATTKPAPGILGVGGWGTAAPFDAIIKRADERSPLAIKDIGKGGLGPSDHMSFALKKVPVLFFFSGTHADYHRPTDDAEKINYEGLEQAVGLVADVVQQVAREDKQEYIAAADAHSMRTGRLSGGTRVTLGIIPDYSAGDALGGVKISGTSANSPAAKAGLKEGDVIVKWNDTDVDSLQQLSDLLARARPNQKVKLKLMRDGEEIETEATLARRE